MPFHTIQRVVMSSRIHIFILLMFPFISTSGNSADWIKGTQTCLQISQLNAPLVPVHGQSIGQTRFVLRSEPGGEELFSKECEGNWFCIGFNPTSKTYIIGGIFERGAWLPLGSIQYLRENGSSFEPSAFDRLGYLAMTMITSPDSRYLVFIGGQNTSGTLYVLDSELDMIKELGSAPAPPPNPLLKDICNSEPFEWGTCWADRYIEMDPAIIRFMSEDVLEVSYGDDLPLARARKRWVRIFKLAELILKD